ncbi:MAG: hypothetical protein HDS11_01760 [Bacteroides sp.]|nr:hypothetical protein [Bacteroides sp.]MBD5377704.1 hypothetical protein [Bacteroides sp.]
MRRHILASTFIGAALSAAAGGAPFINHSKPASLLDFEVHALIGGSAITQNYQKSFPQISELATSMGVSGGIGAEATANFSDFLALGMEINFLANNFKMNTAVADDDATSITNVFVKNRFYTFNFPVFMRFNFNLGNSVRWNLDAGGFYSYGITGTSSTTLYSALVNPVGQLITSVTSEDYKYYNSDNTFIASSWRGDFGFHFGTGLTVRRCVRLGVSSQIGLKNVAHAYNAVKTPRVHNYNVMCSLGWCF